MRLAVSSIPSSDGRQQLLPIDRLGNKVGNAQLAPDPITVVCRTGMNKRDRRWSPLHRFADTRNRVTSLATCPTNSGLRLPHGLVNATLSLQIVIVCQRADCLLDLALRLVDLPFPLGLVPHLTPPDIVSWRSIRRRYARKRRPLTRPTHPSMQQSVTRVCAF
jgi:hypothetical protein